MPQNLQSASRRCLAKPVTNTTNVRKGQAITRSDGLQGIIFTPTYMNGTGTSAVLSLPDGHLPKIKMISFYVADPVSLDDVEAVLNSASVKQ
jgi:hypothetical protein